MVVMSYPTLCDSSASLLSVVLHHALNTPHNDFLVEDKDASLSYEQSYLLATQLIPTRIRVLCPSLDAVSDTKVVLLTHNNVLCALSFLAFWSMSISVIPISASAEPHLWAGMVQFVDPRLILVAPDLIQRLRAALEKTALDKKYTEVIDLWSLVPPEFLAQSGASIRASDFVPSCRSWLKHAFPATSTLQRVLMDTPPPVVPPGGRAITLFTSSAVDWSTLKSVSYTHEMLVQSSSRAIQMLGGPSFSAKPKRHLGWLPLSHCFEFCITFCGIVLGTGGAYIFFDSALSSPSLSPSTPLPPRLLASLAYNHPVTSFTTIPAVFTALIPECTPADLERLRTLDSLGVGGAPTPETLFQWAASHGIPYFDCSGATEAAGTICIRRARDPSQRLHGLQVIPGLVGALEKANLSDCFGQLVIRGTCLPTGYDSRESDAFHFDPVSGITTYRTGDIYSHKEDIPVLSYLSGDPVPPYDPSVEAMSGLAYIGRTDDLVIFPSGVKIDVLALERILDAHASILRSAILGNIAGDALVALIQPQSASNGTAEPHPIIEAVLRLNELLPLEKRLSRENIYIVGDLPVTSKSTLNRKKIKKIFSEIKRDRDIPAKFPPPTALPRVPPGCVGGGELGKRHLDAADVRRRVIQILAHIFSVQESHFDGPDAPLVHHPLTSLSSVRLAKALQDKFSVRITSAQLYGIHTIDDLCSVIENGRRQDVDPSTRPAPAPQAISGTGRQAGDGVPPSAEDIVISGAACRFVGGIDSLDSFWSALLSPETFVKHLPKARPQSRWEGPHPNEDMMYASGWLDEAALDGVSSFAEFFGFTPKAAAAMTPNSRLALQLGYQAIEDAGIAPKALRGRNWGVFTCANDSGWRERRVAALDLKEYASEMQGLADDAVGARLSYFLDLTGPALEIKTACSSSAVAIHQACLAIRNGDCEAAVVIAATTHFHPAGALFRSQSGIVSASGKCVPFSDAADGFVASEGAAAIVLQKRGDGGEEMAYGTVRASSVTQDGASHGFFAPNPKAQRRLLETMLEKAGCVADDISFLEAHGTGTQLGDGVELQAILDAIGVKRTRPLYIGSVKAVVGHTEECAGLAGVLKTLLCMNNNAIPPQPSTGALNEAIDFEACSLVIPTKVTPFLPQVVPRLCGISSFGLSGTLAHIIIQETPHEPASYAYSSCYVFVLSAHCPADYISCIRRYIDFFNAQHLSADRLGAVCRTSQRGRDHFSIRRAWKITGWKGLLGALQEAVVQPPPRAVPLHYKPKLGIWFGLPLCGLPFSANDHPLYHAKMAECRAAGWAAEYVYFTQQLALALCLKALGCDICVVGGEGMAEYVAAVFVGLIPPRAVFRLYAQASDSCQTITARCSGSVLDEHLMSWRADELRIVGRHGSDIFTLRGTPEAVVALAAKPNVTVDLEPLPPQTLLTPVVFSHTPEVPIVSSHLCDVLDDDMATNFNYWSHVGDRDIDGGAALAAMASRCDVVVSLGQGGDICTVLGDKEKCISWKNNSLEDIVSGLFEVGCDVHWETFSSPGPRAHLPSYSWATDAEYDAFSTKD